MKRKWAPAVERSGLTPLTFHELRHSAAAILIDLGAHPVDVRDWLGHEDISTTLNVYGHRFPKRDSQLAAKLDDLYSAAHVLHGGSEPDGDEGGNVVLTREFRSREGGI